MTAIRPSPLLLAPALLAVALDAVALGDIVLLPLCLVALLASYAHRVSLGAGSVRPSAALALAAVATGYYVVVLRSGAGLGPVQRAFAGGEHVLAIAGLVMSLGLVWLWHTPPVPGRTPTAVLALASGPVLASGSFYGHGVTYHALLALFFATCIVASALGDVAAVPRRDRLVRLAWAFGLCAVVGALTLGVAAGLRVAEGLLGVPLQALGLPTYLGLGSGNGMLLARDKRIDLSSRLVAALDGRASPGYLRMQVMDEYLDGHWKAEGGGRRPLEPIEPGPPHAKAAGRWRFDVAPHVGKVTPAEPPAASRRVTLLVDFRGVVPLPYGARSVVLAATGCALAPGEVLECASGGELSEYDVSAVASARDATPAVAGDAEGGSTRAPEAVLGALRPLARRLAGDAAAHPLEAARRIEQHFQESFTYSREVHLAPGEDPVVDFVLNRRPAYCEHFASGMTLLLRSLGISARVAGGFLVEERNEVAGSWVVRERDAHAWTEVLDPETHTWVLFDATPPGGRSQGGESRLGLYWQHARDTLHLAAQAVARFFRTLDPAAAAASALAALGGGLRRRPVVGAIALALSAAILHRLRARFRRGGRRFEWRWGRGRARGTAAHGTLVRSFERVTDALDRRSASLGRSESLEEYARRAEPGVAVARYFTAYRELRFRPAEGAPDLSRLLPLEREAIASLAPRRRRGGTG